MRVHTQHTHTLSYMYKISPRIDTHAYSENAPSEVGDAIKVR
jgi:hypothetical protein